MRARRETASHERGPQAEWSSEGRCPRPARGGTGEEEGRPARRCPWECAVPGATWGRSRQKPRGTDGSAWSKPRRRHLCLRASFLPAHARVPSWLLLLRPFPRGRRGPGAVLDSSDCSGRRVPRRSAEASHPRWGPALPGGSNSASHTCPRVTPPAAPRTEKEADEASSRCTSFDPLRPKRTHYSSPHRSTSPESGSCPAHGGARGS